jgi:uncharacterized protein with von Willebrand factor type A (vWA) domain
MTISPHISDPHPFTTAIVSFCRFVRANGIAAGSKKTLEALAAANILGFKDRSSLRAGLRAVICSSKEEWDLFDGLFEEFWSDLPTAHGVGQRTKRDANQGDTRSIGFLGEGIQSQSLEDGGKSLFGAGQHERLGKVEFSEVAQSDLAELERLSRRLLRRMAVRLARRLKRKMVSRGPVDIRRTIRSSISRGGEPIDLRHKTKRREQNRLVLFLDVSGSMNAYSLFLLQFSYALQKHFQRVHTFLFSTRLIDVTVALRSRSLHQGLAALSREAIGWSGGTKIGESLRELQLCHGRRLLSRDTLFIVLSDGWDTGEPQVLAAELSAIRSRVKRTIWLNPLLGTEGYQPLTRGMSAALPHIDVFAPAHNLESLLQLEEHLTNHRFR